MKFTLSWLNMFIDVNQYSLEEISQCLTYLGHEVEQIKDNTKDLLEFKIAKINNAIPHPEADKLKICEVDTGGEKILQIVCGASNARKGIKVILANIGTIIPNGKFVIKEAEIRGIKSQGMLCSASELLINDLTNDHGIIELPEDAPIGENLSKYYGYEPVFDVNITPNRSDLLGVYGIARELSVKGLGILKKPEIPEISSSYKSSINIHVEDFNKCSLYAIRELKNITNKPSPKWLRSLLENIGITPISTIVDITNYIAFSFGQPLHVYDRSTLTDNLYITINNEPTHFIGLNNNQYNLPQNSLIIKDDEEIQCLAGIMGGLKSACTPNTTNIVLEAAIFNPASIANVGQKLQINTESRYRFERGVDTNFTINALNIATKLILELCGGEASEIIYEEVKRQDSITINFPLNSFERVVGMPIDYNTVKTILNGLGFVINDFSLNSSSQFFNITPPSWRHDINAKEDIIEEIIRVIGYDKIIAKPLPQIAISRIIPSVLKLINCSKRALAIRGYDEVVSWSFMKKSDAEAFGEINENLELVNPISMDLNYMRPSILPNLLKIILKNEVRSIKNLAIFEVGPVFNFSESIEEKLIIAGLRSGLYDSKKWHNDIRNADIYDIKADIEVILQGSNLSISRLQITEKFLPSYYHPTRGGTLLLGKKIIGYFGELHPKILKFMGIKTSIVAFELDFANISITKNKYGRKSELQIYDLQSSLRDFSFIVDKNLEAGNLINFIIGLDKNLITDVILTDIYINEQLFPNKKSITISVKIQPKVKNLSDQELVRISNLIISKVQEKFLAKLRDS